MFKAVSPASLDDSITSNENANLDGLLDSSRNGAPGIHRQRRLT
jgi:hypothetical protein